MRLFAATILAACLAGRVALAQTQDQVDRIDQLATYTLQSAVCTQLGYRVTIDGPAFEANLAKDPELSGLGNNAAGELYNVAIDRRSASFKIDLEKSAAPYLRDPRGLRRWYLQYARACSEIARDPSFSGLVVPPANFDAERAATEAADALLELGGLASWQTPQIQARGDLLNVAGACRGHIGAARSDAIFRRYGATDDQRVRAYYDRSFQLGMTDGLDLSAAQCERAIRSFSAKAGAPAAGR